MFDKLFGVTLLTKGKNARLLDQKVSMIKTNTLGREWEKHNL